MKDTCLLWIVSLHVAISIKVSKIYKINFVAHKLFYITNKYEIYNNVIMVTKKKAINKSQKLFILDHSLLI